MEKQNNKPQKFQTDNVITIAIGHAVHDTYSAFLPTILPVLSQNLSITNTEAGLLSFFQQIVSIIQPFIGNLADKVNLRYIVFLAPGITASLMSLVGITPDYTLLVILMLLVGLSSAGIHTVGPATIGRLSGSKLGMGMSIWMVGGELGRALGPIVFVTAIRYLSIENTPWLMIFGWLASLLLFIRLKNISSQPADARSIIPWKKMVHQMRPILLPLMGIILLSGFLLACTSTYLPLFLTTEGANLWLAGASLTVLETAGVAGAFVSGSISDKVGRKIVLFISLIAASFFMFLFLNTQGLYQFIILFALGFTSLSTSPVMMAIIQENFPENRAFANGMYNAISFAIRSIDIVLVGILSDLFGLRQTFLISAIIMLLSIPVVFSIPKYIQIQTSIDQ